MGGSLGGTRTGGGATPPWANAKGRRGARDSGMLRSDGSFQASAHDKRLRRKDMEGVAD